MMNLGAHRIFSVTLTCAHARPVSKPCAIALTDATGLPCWGVVCSHVSYTDATGLPCWGVVCSRVSQTRCFTTRIRACAGWGPRRGPLLDRAVRFGGYLRAAAGPHSRQVMTRWPAAGHARLGLPQKMGQPQLVIARVSRAQWRA